MPLPRCPTLPSLSALAAWIALPLALLTPPAHGAPAMPQSVEQLWADFDPLKDPVEGEIIREWREDGGVFRQVRYLIGTFHGTPARMAAIYGFPDNAQEPLPAVMHIHGGGQRASLHEVKFLVGRGYAALSLNWGGSGDGKPPFNAAEGARPDDPDTVWGTVDPTQLNSQGYHSLLPGPRQFFHDREHPKNNNWYLLTIGCRRGLTFLQQQPEVDPLRLGVHGFSMGGNLTMYVAGTDRRVRAAVPSVGGSGWRWQADPSLGPGAKPQDRIRGDVEVFRRTLSFESYAPHIACPVLHRSATNDFHGRMDDVYRTNTLIPDQPTRYSWAPHLNHRLVPEVAVTMPLWFDQHLKGGTALPETPHTEIVLEAADGVPLLRVTPDQGAMPVSRCEIYYSIDPDPRARFWRAADARAEAGHFTAQLPLHAVDTPLFAFANVYHTLPEPVSLAALPGHNTPVTEVCISSLLHTHTAADLQAAGVRPTIQPTTLLEDFSHGTRDWYLLNKGNPTHQQLWTRKVTDPLWRAPEGARLALTLVMPQANQLSVVLHQNEWRDYRGPRRTFVCTREIPGSPAPQTLTLDLHDFTSPDGPPPSWDDLDQLGLCAHFAPAAGEPNPWQGPAPTFLRLAWD